MRLTSLLGFIAGSVDHNFIRPAGAARVAQQALRRSFLGHAAYLLRRRGALAAYGIRLWAMPVIVANAVTLALLLIIMALKTRYAAR